VPHNGCVRGADERSAHAAALLGRLSEGDGRAVLEGLPPYADDEVLALASRLRAEGIDPDIVAAALTQARLRARAAARLGPAAAGLLLTADGLEQATRPAVARRHAERFVAAGVDDVWDLGSGVGLDAIALAAAGLAVTAVERDAEVAAAATANLRPYPRARVMHGDVVDVAPTAGEGAWLDPARRTAGVADARGRTRRLFRLSDLSPSWEHVQDVAARAAASGAKLSPGFAPSDLPDGAEAEWVSLDGDVVECVVWWSGAVRRAGISAVLGTTTPDGPTWTTVEPVTDPPPALVPGEQPGPWLAEPDRAVLAAGLTSTLAAAVGGQELTDDVGYVVAPAPVELPWARWFTVEEVLPLHARPVRAWLRERGVGRVTIKKRGVPTDVERFRTELRLRGGRSAPEATLVLTRVAGTPSVLVVTPAAGGATG
jgi:SAM-dependent methyltransferase